MLKSVLCSVARPCAPNSPGLWEALPAAETMLMIVAGPFISQSIFGVSKKLFTVFCSEAFSAQFPGPLGGAAGHQRAEVLRTRGCSKADSGTRDQLPKGHHCASADVRNSVLCCRSTTGRQSPCFKCVIYSLSSHTGMPPVVFLKVESLVLCRYSSLCVNA